MIVYKCGYIKAFESGTTPSWNEFVVRMGFVQNEFELSALFMEPVVDEEGNWVVPFLFAETENSSRHPIQVAQIIKDNTPYEVIGVRIINVAKASVKTLNAISILTPEPAPTIKLDDLIPAYPRLHIEQPEDVFDGLIGMEDQKRKLMRISNTVATYGREALDCFHLVFVGNSGTGKTELAMRLSALLDLIGVTDGTGTFYKVDESDLVAKYVGHTAPKVKQAVTRALGGVLFIDEFYAIANAPYFGREAIDALVDQLETHRNEFVCIIGGYTREVDETLRLNPGLRSRFGFRVEFSDYTDEELADIFVSMAKKRGFAVEDRNVLINCSAKLRGTTDFANARTMRNLLDHAVVEVSEKHGEHTICASDLLVATNELYEAPAKVGF